MIDNGFTVEGTRQANIARYICDCVSLDLPIDIIVKNRSALFHIILEDGYARGLEQGKTDSVRILLQHFSEMIFGTKKNE